MSIVDDRQRDLLIATQRGEGDEILVAPRDSGIGFDPQDADRIFDAFHTAKAGGMGMGLAISRSIIHWHAGTCREMGRKSADPNSRTDNSKDCLGA